MVCWNVELVAVFIGEQQVVALGTTDGSLHHSFVFSNAVIMVNYVVAWLQVLKDRSGVTLACPRLAMRAASTSEVGFCNDCKFYLRKRIAMMQWCNHHVRAGFTEVRFFALDVVAHDDTVLREHFEQPLCRAFALGGNHHSPLIGYQLLNAFGSCFCIAGRLTPTS